MLLPDESPAPVFEILDLASTSDRRRWLALWESWPAREVFAHPGYLGLFASDSSQPLCATLRLGEARVLYPFLFRDLSAQPWAKGTTPLADITSPYGQGGAVAWGADDRDVLAAEFWRAFDAWAFDNHVVSEFVRLPLFEEDLLADSAERLHEFDCVVRSLEPSLDELWMDFKHKVRKNVGKAQRNNLQVEVDTDGSRLDGFVDVYAHTMERRCAAKWYSFSRSFFESLIDNLRGQFAFFHTTLNGRAVSTELVLISSSTIYSYLGGTLRSAFEFRPNDLLKYEIMRWGKDQGMRRFLMGGGHGSNDSIYRFKLSFAPRGSVPFFTGRRVLEGSAYDRLVADRRGFAETQGEAWQPQSRFFPSYRG